MSNHPHTHRIENSLLWCKYNNFSVVLQGNPVPALASLHIHQFAAAPPNIFIPPPVVHPQGPALNHFAAGPYAPPPVVHQPPPLIPISGHQHAPFMPPPPTWATRMSASSSPDATRPFRPTFPSQFHSWSPIPNMGCTVPILHCPASCTSASTEQQQF